MTYPARVSVYEYAAALQTQAAPPPHTPSPPFLPLTSRPEASFRVPPARRKRPRAIARTPPARMAPFLTDATADATAFPFQDVTAILFRGTFLRYELQRMAAAVAGREQTAPVGVAFAERFLV